MLGLNLRLNFAIEIRLITQLVSNHRVSAR